jgi:hypothetical protein
MSRRPFGNSPQQAGQRWSRTRGNRGNLVGGTAPRGSNRLSDLETNCPPCNPVIFLATESVCGPIPKPKSGCQGTWLCQMQQSIGCPSRCAGPTIVSWRCSPISYIANKSQPSYTTTKTTTAARSPTAMVRATTTTSAYRAATTAASPRLTTTSTDRSATPTTSPRMTSTTSYPVTTTPAVSTRTMTTTTPMTGYTTSATSRASSGSSVYRTSVSAQPTMTASGSYDVPIYSNVEYSASATASASPSSYPVNAGVSERVPWKATLTLVAGYLVALLL